MYKISVFILFSLISCSALARPKRIIDQTHDTISDGVLTLSKQIDSFFGEDEETEPINRSKFRIYTTTLKEEGLEPKTLLLYKFQLVLPKTQKRLQIVIEPEDDESSEGAAGGTSRKTSKKAKQKSTTEDFQNTTTAALRFIVDTAEIKTSIDTGIIAEIPPKPFIRFRFKRKIPLQNDWVFKGKETIKWVHDDKTSSDLDLNFDKPFKRSKLGRRWLLRMVNNFYWDDDTYSISMTNGPTWFHTINKKIGMNYNANIISTNSPNLQVENYFFSVGYRQLLYKKWFFWQVTPALEFPRLENFHRTPSLTIRFEAIFGRI